MDSQQIDKIKAWAAKNPILVGGVIVLLLFDFFVASSVGWWLLVVDIIVVGIALYVLFRASPNRAAVTRQLPATPQVQANTHDLSKLEGKYRDCMNRALQRQASIKQAIADTPDQGLRHALEDATKDLPELIDTIYGLAMKAGSVQTAIQSSSSMESLADDIKRLETSIKGTTDEFQRSQYYAALDGKLQQMQNMTDTRVAIERWDAQIDNALSTLDTLLSQVVRIKSSEVLSYTGATDDISHSLREEVEFAQSDCRCGR